MHLLSNLLLTSVALCPIVQNVGAVPTPPGPGSEGFPTASKVAVNERRHATVKMKAILLVVHLLFIDSLQHTVDSKYVIAFGDPRRAEFQKVTDTGKEFFGLFLDLFGELDNSGGLEPSPRHCQEQQSCKRAAY
ncbi:hypothetical protein F5878DRAFT_668285 [Lentinula raphanica]|uniref:Uncharacterized protein n=1 Tax=Lentinula raphanica TaxID=153919 RepID=A0AA38U218_9AGAR|nr:hypothetical protein F5878DRAFT_668285 [Lentinula raphanica]